jgi:hypothetical protein
MKTTFTVNELSAWIKSLKQSAADDEKFNVSFFPGTRDAAVCIIGGWKPGFGAAYSDLLCVSQSDPTLTMCVSIVMNPGSGSMAHRDFNSFILPTEFGEEDDTTVALEWEDDPDAAADFYFGEWERICERQEAMAK